MNTPSESTSEIVKIFSRAMPSEFTVIIVAVMVIIPSGNEKQIVLLGIVAAILMAIFSPRIESTGTLTRRVLWRILLFQSCLAWVLVLQQGAANEILQQLFSTVEDLTGWLRFYIGVILIANVVLYGIADSAKKSGTTSDNKSPSANPNARPVAGG